MEENLLQQYINCYNKLSQPQYSKLANQTLLQIQDSFHAWDIAYQLISNPDNEIALHGAQLLSKKLNVPPPSQVDLQIFTGLLYNLPHKLPLNWLCLAKIVVHLCPEQPQLPNDLSSQQKLKFLREIPAAITHIRTEKSIDNLSMKEKYLSLATPFLLSQFHKSTDLIIDCLDSFVTYGTKIRNPQIIKALMSLPFEEGGHILQEILSRESYPELQTELISYLQKERNQANIFEMYVSFLKTVDFTKIARQKLQNILQSVLNCLYSQQYQIKSKVQESYELWFQMAKQYRQKNLSLQVKSVIRDALLVVLTLTQKESVLQQIPQHSQIKNDPLDLGGSDEQQPTIFIRQTNNTQKFRQYAGDFILVCFETLGHQPEALSIIINMIQQLLSGQLLHLQLAIWIIFCLTPAKNNLLAHTANIIARIFSRSNQMNEHLCRQVIRMIGQLSGIFSEIPDLLKPALQFLSRSFQSPNLAILASTSCCTLLEQIDLQKASALVQLMQFFMEHIYDVIFKPGCEEKVIEMLCKTMAIFVYKVKNNPEDYSTYLKDFLQRISLEKKENQPKFIEAAITGQFWINSQQQIKKNESEQNQSKFNNYMPAFSSFLQTVARLLHQLLSVSEKNVFFKRLLLVNLAVRTNCIGNGQIWVQMCDYLLSNYLKGLKPIQTTKIISPLMNLARAACQLKIQNVAIVVSSALRKWHNQITGLLDINSKRIDLILSSSVVHFHVRIVEVIKIFTECASIIGYSPQPIVNYVTWTLGNSQVWEYQMFKFSLQYLLIVLQLGYSAQDILACLLKSFDRLQQALWTSLNPILSYIFKNYGFEIYQKTLEQMNSKLADENNPLNTILRGAFANEEMKTVKNLLMSL